MVVGGVDVCVGVCVQALHICEPEGLPFRGCGRGAKTGAYVLAVVVHVQWWQGEDVLITSQNTGFPVPQHVRVGFANVQQEEFVDVCAGVCGRVFHIVKGFVF